jgi:hypothetical protein
MRRRRAPRRWRTGAGTRPSGWRRRSSSLSTARSKPIEAEEARAQRRADEIEGQAAQSERVADTLAAARRNIAEERRQLKKFPATLSRWASDEVGLQHRSALAVSVHARPLAPRVLHLLDEGDTRVLSGWVCVKGALPGSCSGQDDHPIALEHA